MYFPISELDRDAYFKQVVTTLQDKDCKVFLDTNILAKYYVFHSQARKELNDWLTSLATLKKLQLPVWVLNEYSKHVIRQRTKEYMNDGNLIGDITKNFEKFKSFLTMYAEPADLSKFGYVDSQALQDDMKAIQNKLANFSKMKATQKEHEIRIHNEITDLLKDCILDSDIFSLSDRISVSAVSRYANELPPGFEDGGKINNAYGDLILWKEILEWSEKQKVKKAILITNDHKRDWVYAPQKLMINGRSVFNPYPYLKIIDTRLSYEFKLATQSDEIYIITLGTLTQALLQNGDKNLYELAKALQLEFEEEEEQKNKSSELSSDALSADMAKDILATVGELDQSAILDKEKKLQKGTDYAELALKDKNYLAFKSSVIAGVVTELKSSNWYVQNPAIDKISFLTDAHISAIPELKNDLFVLGRNIYQSAVGGAYNAITYVLNLCELEDDSHPVLNRHILNGVFYELYFDSEGTLRIGDFKTGLITDLFNCKIKKQYNPFEFIEAQLKPFIDKLFLLPGQQAAIHFTIKWVAERDDDLWGKVADLKALIYENENLLSKVNDEQTYGALLDIKELKVQLERSFAIPLKYIDLQYDPVAEDISHLFIRFNYKFIREERTT